MNKREKINFFSQAPFKIEQGKGLEKQRKFKLFSKTINLFSIAVVLFFTLSCNKKENTEEAGQKVPTPGQIEVSLGMQRGTISLSDTVKISYDGNTLVGRKKEDRTRYENEAGMLLYEVKQDSDGDFKLRDENGNLLWKVKRKPEKFKISNNEEGKEPLEVKLKDSTTLKLEKNDADIGKVVLKDGKVVLANSDEKNFISTNTLFLAFGILFLPEITDIQKLILIAEGMEN